MRRKGSAIILVITVFAIFSSVSVFVAALNASDTFSNAVEYRSGDVSVLAQTQVQKENLKDQYRAGLRYSLNDAAFELADSNVWRDEIPEKEPVKSEYFDRASAKFDERMNDLSTGCEVGDVDVEAKQGGGYRVLTAGETVKCSRAHTSAENYFTDDLDVENPENRYMTLVGEAMAISEDFKNDLPSEIKGSDSHTGACGGSKSSVVSSAESGAKDDATLDGTGYDSDKSGVKVDYSISYSGESWSTDTEETRCCEGGWVTRRGEKECSDWDEYYSADSTYTADAAVLDLSLTDEENRIVYSEGPENLEYNVEYRYSSD